MITENSKRESGIFMPQSMIFAQKDLLALKIDTRQAYLAEYSLTRSPGVPNDAVSDSRCVLSVSTVSLKELVSMSYFHLSCSPIRSVDDDLERSWHHFQEAGNESNWRV